VVSGSIKDEHIELRFSDNCGGITPENIDKIFEPFFTTKPPSEGTGLGLCIVQRIVSGAGGKVWVKSKHGIGSTFFVTLPIGKDGKY
jgi:signal transduction histidine kinase